ncbi:hypothetical protein MKX03_010718, partial [Papaver bracteatum]
MFMGNGFDGRYLWVDLDSTEKMELFRAETILLKSLRMASIISFTFRESVEDVAPRSNTFMPFGNGVHSCPWNELAKVEILILLHLLITKF